MNSTMPGLALTVLALSTGFIACSDGADEAEVSVEKEGDHIDADTTTILPPAAGGSDTTVILNNSDTVTQTRVDTVTRTRTDTVVRTDTVKTGNSGTTVSASDRAAIDKWLAANDATLNEYGDPEGTVYAGGTPLFDEATGTRLTKYEYIVRKHPDRPWTKMPTEATRRR